MQFTLWYLIVGTLLVLMALAATVIKRLPLTSSLLYLAVGVALGPFAAGLIRVDPLAHPVLLERLTEVAVLVSLFTAGLKLRMPVGDPIWRLPLRLASLSMAVTVGLIAAAGVWLLELPLGVAVLLGAILAPTDPVLAADVQVAHPGDQDELRYALTGEAGLNDGTAFPFVMLGLGIMGLHDVGPFGWKWLAVDVVWAVVGGLAIGAAAGSLVGRFVVYLRKTHREGVGLDDFLSLGLLALAYGAALAAHTYGFLAAFAAGLALRRVESSASNDGAVDKPPPEVSAAAHAGDAEKVATDAKTAPAYMASAVLGFNEQLERMFEVALVVLLGGMLSRAYLPTEAIWFVPLLLLVIRPLAVAVGLLGASATPARRRLVSWFGIRGVGSIYYLMYAVNHGLAGPEAKLLTGLVFTAAVVSIAVHGVSVTPLMNLYERIGRRKGEDSSKDQKGTAAGVFANDEDEPVLAGASGRRD